jgi:hypothetical protein
VCLGFLRRFVCNISHSKKNSARCYRKCISVCFMWSIPYSCQSVMKLEFSRQILEKYSNINFRENPFSGSRVVLCGRTDMTKLRVAFRNITNTAPKKLNPVSTNRISKRDTDDNHRRPYTMPALLNISYSQPQVHKSCTIIKLSVSATWLLLKCVCWMRRGLTAHWASSARTKAQWPLLIPFAADVK